MTGTSPTGPGSFRMRAATIDLALGNVEVSWAIDGQASAAALRCAAEDVTFWVVKLGESDGVVVGCVNGRWSVSFKAVPAGTYVARVEAQNGTPRVGRSSSRRRCW